jgi:hypothetical protein
MVSAQGTLFPESDDEALDNIYSGEGVPDPAFYYQSTTSSAI